MEPFRIESIEMNEIGPFDWIHIEFPKKERSGAEIQVFTGENGTGKSTVLRLLAFCIPPNKKSNLSNKLRKNYLTNDFFIRFADRVLHLNGDILISADYYGWSIKFKEYYSKLVGTRLGAYYRSYGDEIGSGYESTLFAYSGYRKLGKSVVDSISEVNENPINDALDFDRDSSNDLLVKWLSIVLTKRALLFNNDLDKKVLSTEEEAIHLIELIIGEFIESEVYFELKVSPLSVVIHVAEEILEFDQVPDGLQSVISWIGDLVMRLSRIRWREKCKIRERNFILLLDEIEVHLHPAWQRKILPVLQKTFPNAQIFISTHSPFVIGSVDGAWVHRFEKKGGMSVLQGPPILSEDSYSYEYILREIFGIKERFGVEVEKLLAEFRTMRNAMMHGQEADRARFDEVVKQLMAQSSEVQSIVGMELRQLDRILNQPAA